MHYKNIKYWILGGLLVLNIFINLAPVDSKADGNIQSNGKIVYDNTSATGEEIVIDTNDHTLLKNNIIANNTEILSLKEYSTLQTNYNEQLQNKDTSLADDIAEINANLGNNIFIYNETEDAYYIKNTADSTPKKLGSSEGGLLKKQALTTTDLKTITSHYSELTLHNFACVLTRVDGSTGSYSSDVGGSGSFAFDENNTLSYNASTGILNVTSGTIKANIGKSTSVPYARAYYSVVVIMPETWYDK